MRSEHSELLELKRWNTPTIYNGWEQITKCDQSRLLEAAKFMDSNECQTLIAAARNSQGKTTQEILQAIDQAAIEFNRNAKEKYGGKGKW